jgi:hypothetical protein
MVAMKKLLKPFIYGLLMLIALALYFIPEVPAQ